MVSLAIGTFIIGGALSVYIKSRETYTLTESLARMQETASFALKQMEPDIQLAQVRVEQRKKSDLKPLKEKDLSGHLGNGNGKNKDGKDKSKAKQERSMAERDYQLNEALNLLKGLHIMHGVKKT